MKLWMRAATVATIAWSIAWYLVYGQDMLAEIQDAPVKHRQQAEDYRNHQKWCDNYNSGRSKADHGFDPDKFLCERTSGEPPETDIALRTAQDYLWPLAGSVLVIWGFFAMLQWLIRGTL
jgi:hypothetical protein